MEVDSSQAPQHPHPAQALQATTDQIQIMQKHYQEVVNTSGPDSQLAIGYKKMMEQLSYKVTPIAIVKDSR
eukprot:1342860-Karenia_brevis.AAC.1